MDFGVVDLGLADFDRQVAAQGGIFCSFGDFFFRLDD